MMHILYLVSILFYLSQLVHYNCCGL